MRSFHGRRFALSGNSRWNEEGNFQKFSRSSMWKHYLDEGNDVDGFCIFDNASGRRGIEVMDLSGLFPLKRLP